MLLTGRGSTSRLGGGITRGPGETKLETERRAVSRRIADCNGSRPAASPQVTPAAAPPTSGGTLSGYSWLYQRGKSTLLNALTNAEVYTADQLFATLDPTTRRLMIPDAVTEPSRLYLQTQWVYS